MSNGEQGFTLLEVLIAFVIAALALGIFYEGSLAGLRGAQVAGQYEEAVSLARSHLAELSQRGNATALESEGTDGPIFHYIIRSKQLAGAMLQRSLLDQDNNRVPRQAMLYGLSITEYWTEAGRRREVHLLGENMVVQGAPQ